MDHQTYSIVLAVITVVAIVVVQVGFGRLARRRRQEGRAGFWTKDLRDYFKRHR